MTLIHLNTTRLSLLAHELEVGVYLLEAALAQVADDLLLPLGHDLAPVLEEVPVEHLLRGVVVVNHAPVEGRHLSENGSCEVVCTMYCLNT